MTEQCYIEIDISNDSNLICPFVDCLLVHEKFMADQYHLTEDCLTWCSEFLKGKVEVQKHFLDKIPTTQKEIKENDIFSKVFTERYIAKYVCYLVRFENPEDLLFFKLRWL